MKRLAFLLLCLLSMAGIASAQVRTVKGTVTSSKDGQGVIGAYVLVTGTNIGTVTDLDGNYILEGVPSSAKTLTFSCIGMVSAEKPIAQVVNVSLDTDSELLENAIVTIAYGAAKKSSLTGAISSVDEKQLAMRPVSSVSSALEGTVSGIQVAGSYGAAGEAPAIRIRGFGTINGSSSPLYVIDGVPFDGNISDLNPSDIESLTVLKDAASAALYGNRASNGVILITTKSAKSGRVAVSLDIKQGVFTRAIPEYERMNDRQWMETEWINVRNNRLTSGDSADAAATFASKNLISTIAGLNIYNKANDALFTTDGKLVSDAQILDGYRDDLDWFSQAIRKGHRQEYNVNASAGNTNSDVYFSLGYLDENGYMTNNDFDRITGRMSANVRPTTWLKLGLNLAGSHQNTNNTSGVGDGGSSYVNSFMYCRNIAPIYPVHLHDVNTGEYILDDKGNRQYDSGSYKDADGNTVTTRNQYADRHSIWENELNSDKTVRNTLDGTAFADFNFLKDFTFTVRGNLNVRNNDEQTYNSAVIGDGKGNKGRASKTVYRYKNYTFQQQLRWSHQYGDHSVSALLAHENYYFNYNYTYGYKTTETFAGKLNLSNFTDITSFTGYDNNYRTESYLSRVRYNYQDKYNVEASFRRDGSSRFAPQSRWGNFWSIGANWLITKEDFMRSAPWVNSLKLRADYGEVGNDSGAGYYGYMALYTSSKVNNLGAYYLGQNSNYDLKWETGQSWGIGIESRLFDRWNLNVDYFNKRNKDLLFDVYLPLSAGATSASAAEATVTKNLGVISNKGIEIETDVDIFRNKDWNINVGGNVSFLKNRIVKLPEQNKDGIIDGTKKYVEGGDRYAFYLYQFAGVDQMTGRSLYKFNDEDYYITDNNTASGNVIYGSATDKDGNANTLMSAANYSIVNGEAYSYKTTYAKRDFCGSAIPKAYGSFNMRVSYKAFSLSSIFTYSLGGYTYDGVYGSLMSVTASPSSIHADNLKAWNGVPDGMTETSANRIDPNGIPQVNYGLSSDNNAGTSSRWLVSSNYLVFKNLALSYRLPKSWAKALTMEGITVSAQCENLFTLTARQGMNPQQSFSGTQDNYLVPARVFTGAVSFKF